jgi:hypothetical protein
MFGGPSQFASLSGPSKKLGTEQRNPLEEVAVSIQTPTFTNE